MQVAATEVPKSQTWIKLFKKIRFFGNFNHFIKIDILSHEGEAHRKWLGYVESTLRRLLIALNDNKDIQEIRVYPKAFQRSETQMEQDKIIEGFNFCDTYFIGIKFIVTQAEDGMNQFDLREPITHFCRLLEVWRVKKDVNNLRIIHITKSLLPQ
jgi:poly(A) polymerase